MTYYAGPRTEMIERIAKAIRDSNYGTGSTEPHEEFMDDAYAALNAMLEPNEEMLNSFAASEVHGQAAARIWRGMVAAALSVT